MVNEKKLDRIEVITSKRGICIITFPYRVKVDKALFDAEAEVNRSLASYDARLDHAAEQCYDLGICYSGPKRLPFCQVDVKRRQNFKKQHLVSSDKAIDEASDDSSYTFELENWCRLDKVLSQTTTEDGKQIVTISGSYYEQAITATEWIMEPSDYKGTFTFDAEGNFLSCNYNGHSSDEVAGTKVLYR